MGQQFGISHTLHKMKTTLGTEKQTGFISVVAKKKPALTIVEHKKHIPLRDETEKQVVYG